MKLEALLVQLRVMKDSERRSTLLKEIRQDLGKHMQLEEDIFYPACREVKKLEGQIEHSYDEHQEVRNILDDLNTMDPSNSKFSHRVTKLIANIEKHVFEEENRIFGLVRRHMEPSAFDRLSREMIKAHGAPMKKMRRAA